ncbi:hypothetical protein SLEP1_g42987 [Rubroshorea leprosula]|uniref:BHLH domain-containing protein n=1 Tax=Rubroshorea leprosula TaxID=152421 RepID=A0AAV5LBK5_9ROSI|nr:hypothetical protein SLEP1_g42987 [Rubroshorea leprosula]
MDSTTHQNFELQNQQPSSGLLRFRSAPSSFLSNFSGSLDSGVNKVSLDSERLISRFANSSGGGGDIHDKSRVTAAEAVAVTYANSQQSYSGLPPHYPRHGSVTSFSSAMDGRYEFLAAGQQTQGKSVSSSLMRQTSSPPGLFANISVQDGYATMKGVGNYGGVSGSNGDVSLSSNRLKSQLSFSSRVPSSLGMLSQISEIESESIETRVPDDDNKLRTSSGDGRFYGTDFLYGSWNDSSNFTENFCGMKREQDDRKLFSSIQNGDLGGRVQLLSHHLSLPKSSTEMVAMEKYLHFQDSVPCKIRAKRGCATHPRSIAERIRRTRISERMRKLQELVPNMDKQTNTADMLDLAVDYIKDLQKQFKTLSDIRANCKCINIQKPVSNQIV